MSHATPPGRNQEALDAARALTGSVNGLSSRLDEVKTGSEERDAALARYGRLNRILIIIAVVGLLLDVTATTVAFVALHGERNAIAAAKRNAATVQDVHASNLAGCQANNVRLARQESVLNGILRTPAHATPAARAYLAHARAEIAVGWASRNCERAYRIKP
jgi:hypothetical protein